MNYHRELDGLRWFAVCAVLVAHFPVIQDFEPWSLVKSFGSALRFGYLGVDIFFVLSGFLITRILYAERSYPLTAVLKSFFAKRALRILPIYLLCILYSWIVLSISREEALANLFFFSNYYYSFHDHASPLRHTWSLAVEEQFYFVWPFVILLVPLAFLTRVIVWLSLLLSALTIIAFLYLVSEEILNNLLVRTTSLRLLSLSAGALMALHYDRLFVLDRRVFLLLSTLVFPLVQAAVRYFDFTYAQIILVPVFTAWSTSIFLSVLLYGDGRSTSKNLIKVIFQNSIVVYIGRISYGLYLYHLIVLHQMDLRESYRPEGVTWIEFLVGLILCFLIAIVSFEFIEKPLSRLKSRYRLQRGVGKNAGRSVL